MRCDVRSLVDDEKGLTDVSAVEHTVKDQPERTRLVLCDARME